MKQLLEKYEGDHERVGFILRDDTIVEVTNISSAPADEFRVSGEDLAKYETTAVATWHTHPGTSANLSMSDRAAFLNYPHLTHYIVGKNGVKAYVVEDGEVYHGS